LALKPADYITLTDNEILREVTQIAGKDSQTLWCSVCILFPLKYNSVSHNEEGSKSISKGVRVFSTTAFPQQ